MVEGCSQVQELAPGLQQAVRVPNANGFELFFDQDLCKFILVLFNEPLNPIEVDLKCLDTDIFGVSYELLVKQFLVKVDGFLLFGYCLGGFGVFYAGRDEITQRKVD